MSKFARWCEALHARQIAGTVSAWAPEDLPEDAPNLRRMVEDARKVSSEPLGATKGDPGTTSYTGVIRGAGEAETHPYTGRDFWERQCDSLVLSNDRFISEVAALTAEVARLAADLLAKDARIERVKALIPKWVSDRATYPLDNGSASYAFIAVKLCGEELTEALDAPTEPAPNLKRQDDTPSFFGATPKRGCPCGCSPPTNFIGADLGLDDDPDTVERLRAARIQAALNRRSL